MNIFEINEALAKALHDLEKCKPVIEINFIFNPRISESGYTSIPGKPGRITARTYINSIWYLVKLKTDIFYSKLDESRYYSDDYEFINEGKKTEHVICKSIVFDRSLLRSEELKRVIGHLQGMLLDEQGKTLTRDFK